MWRLVLRVRAVLDHLNVHISVGVLVGFLLKKGCNSRDVRQ